MFRHGIHVINVLHRQLTKRTHRDKAATRVQGFTNLHDMAGLSPEPLPDLLLVVPGVVPQVLDVLWGQPRLPAVLVPHEPPPLS